MFSNAYYRPVTYKIGNQGQVQTPSQMPSQVQGAATMPPSIASGGAITPSGVVTPTAPPAFEQSYIENILRLNLGKIGTFYMTYENNSEWNAKIFKGVLEAAGRDHIIISDPATGRRTILLMVNLDFATFDEPLTYQYPGVIGAPPVPSPRF
ncbi:spore coat protein GerQ [Paenibacillus caui]|uniref:spore coat protein GerQ n=1 Tax=Paenibacillus caui TaxID=2873927 RepID=UPI001CA9CA95|nr:spore coat protein GerQ [Paenibacillus caui]